MMQRDARPYAPSKKFCLTICSIVLECLVRSDNVELGRPVTRFQHISTYSYTYFK